MKSRLLLAIAAFATFANAHLVYVIPDQSASNTRIVMSENLAPDLDVGIIAGTKLSVRDARGAVTPLALLKTEPNFFSAAIAGSGTRVVYGTTDLGVMTRGNKPHWLIYYPKAIVGDAFAESTRLGEKVPVELVPVGRPGDLKLRLIAKGKAQPDSEILLILPDGTEKKVRTDSTGETPTLPATGRYGAWARYWEPIADEQGGKKFEEIRYYATILFDAGEAAKARISSFTTLPEPTSSFGAAAAGGWLYVYGGHVSPQHSYFKEAVSGNFARVSLTGDPVWETLPAGPAVQGMNLAAHRSGIYRVGGMQPRNERGQPSDNHSIAGVARFNLATKKWEDLPPLPQPRSAHDVAVVGDQLIVVGGWTLAGKTDVWRDTVEVLDVSSKAPVWTSAPQPFQRRALMTAALDGKVYVIGGMNAKQQVERTVSIFDPKTKTWAHGPELPKGALLGFAPAAGLHEGRLYVSLGDGSLLRLNAAKNGWEKAGESSPRIAHRLASRGHSILLIGGAAKGKMIDVVEAIPVE